MDIKYIFKIFQQILSYIGIQIFKFYKFCFGLGLKI